VKGKKGAYGFIKTQYQLLKDRWWKTKADLFLEGGQKTKSRSKSKSNGFVLDELKTKLARAERLKKRV